MSRLGLLASACLLGILAGLPFAASAAGDVFEPISLASASSRTQADRANDAVISGSGRYVAFDGSFAGVSGVFRRDLLTGQVVTVAEGDAALPSISEDGRYVSFTTTARLDELDDTNVAPDVYVRDMGNSDGSACGTERVEAGECAFTLASAVDGSRTGLSYHYTGARNLEETHYGSLASGRSALTADGRRVAFITTVESNLANPGRPAVPSAGEPPETPALQVAVRDLDTERTQLVSVLYEGGHVAESSSGQTLPVPQSGSSSEAYGAVYPGGRFPPSFGSPSAGASISADGSTVAWIGQQLYDQVPLLPNEPKLSPQGSSSASYAEPLWRRIADGQQAPTRRVTGGGDPTSEQCIASGESGPASPPTLSDPCQGPFDTTESLGGSSGVWSLSPNAGDYLPRLSGDGRTVVFLANAPQLGRGEFGRSSELSDDLYVVDMHDGLSRVRALRRLTQIAGGSVSEPQRIAPVADLGVSPDGSEVAFTTERTIFPLGSPTYVSAPAPVATAQELFDIDLSNDTLTRVSQGYEGGVSEPAGAVAGSPSFSSDGNLLAFASSAYNLVYGDGNGASDAFVVRRKRFPASAVQQFISAAPANPGIGPSWLLGVTARSRADGAVVLEAQVPGAGALDGVARSAMRARRCAAAKRRRCHHAASVVTRSVASRLVRPRAAELTKAVLTLAPRYRALAGRRGGLSAYVTVTFSATGHPNLRQRIPVTFRRTAMHRKGASEAGSHKRHRGRR
jgi:Tol biopolymer transport system component